MVRVRSVGDLPSRDDLRLLFELGSAPFEVRWPDMSPAWAGVFDRIFDEFAPVQSKGEKRSHRQIDADIEEETCRRRAQKR